MKKVDIPKKGTFKCVVLSDGENTVFRAGFGSYHADVQRNAKNKEPELARYQCYGGGRIEIRPEYARNADGEIEFKEEGLPKLRVYGHSVGFGYMDKAEVEELLSEYCKENNLEFINEAGQGY